jgi:hypothetical protein
MAIVQVPATSGRTKITPPQMAREYGVEPAKIISWIKSGELRAIDASEHRNERPRYLIDRADIAEFEAARAVCPASRVSRIRRRSTSGVTEFF